uniref:RNA polymerase sigma-70 domain-containing protein n=1 Tax=Attheya septentrionalis TaxID=420275 RepID=A0A7S2UP05_9STRA|mmetsp:Transcript_6420/g.11426  ORF Transcript_6420/g.11426 Transcript_6420/m.11426 type:complete len:650 (+) Transcript_6420:190-2139(+)|eukprot:CAMPEP_0198286850 /NCGR_PEP_ID=MMETSP1449-20131203/5817_1 /TAXON_ID=420275 /ORGANISM="Attheya septentrionalis, Strain CCMP2084" /LENGTH=649 /DNA_ID=CAMNT_0043984675 /DNA_START=166 /DNA_END=2115 /DNA_ORIENTATION=+
MRQEFSQNNPSSLSPPLASRVSADISDDMESAHQCRRGRRRWTSIATTLALSLPTGSSFVSPSGVSRGAIIASPWSASTSDQTVPSSPYRSFASHPLMTLTDPETLLSSDLWIGDDKEKMFIMSSSKYRDRRNRVKPTITKSKMNTPAEKSKTTAKKKKVSKKIASLTNERLVDTELMTSFAGPIVENENTIIAVPPRRDQDYIPTRSSPKRTLPTKQQRVRIKTKLASTSAPSISEGDFNDSRKHGSKSSTMPGFRTRSQTGRRKAFNDGIRIVEQTSGRNLQHLLKSKENSLKQKEKNSISMYKRSATVPDSLIQFSNEIHSKSRITPKEEKELGAKTQEALKLQQMYETLKVNLNREPTDDEWCAAAGKINTEAIRQAIEDGLAAKNELVTANLRMVQGVVNLYIRNGLGSQYNAGDLMQEGTIALIRAAEKFEPQRGFRFSTYAMYWIRAAVKKSQTVQSRAVSVPQRLHENYKRVLKTENELTKELGRKPTPDELAVASEMSVAQLERCVRALSQRYYSLDAEIDNGFKPNNSGTRKDTMHDIVQAKTDSSENQKVQRMFIKDDLIETMRRYLTPDEVDLLLLRYGLMDERTAPHGFSGPLTIAEVSRLVGYKPDKVRRMLISALDQLKHLIADEWADFENELP